MMMMIFGFKTQILMNYIQKVKKSQLLSMKKQAKQNKTNYIKLKMSNAIIQDVKDIWITAQTFQLRQLPINLRCHRIREQ